MNQKISGNDNFLELIPKKNKEQKFEINEQGIVQIIIPRDRMLDKIVRIFLKTPKTMKIDLDPIGSCVWNAIDGERTIEQIGNILKNEFGEEIEPLYERLGMYINILRNNKFITLIKVK